MADTLYKNPLNVKQFVDQRGLIFYEVRIFNQKTKTKKVLSSKLLSKRYWNAFNKNNRNTESPNQTRFKKKISPTINKTERVNHNF